MGRRTSQWLPTAEPRPRKKQKTILDGLKRSMALSVAFLVLFAASGFLLSSSFEDEVLKPPTMEQPRYTLEVIDVSDSMLSVRGPGSDDQLNRVGTEGIEWADGFVQSPGIESSQKNGRSRIEIRSIDPGDTAPPVGALVSFDPFVYTGNPLDALGIEYDEVFYSSNVGRFPAWFIPGSSDTWAIVVHGKGASREEALRIIPLLKDLGYPTLVICYRNDRGQARDPSRYHQYGKTEWADLAAAVLYSDENGATDNILIGYSMGGAIVTSFLSRSPLRNRTKATILDSPILDLEQTIDFRTTHDTIPLLPFSVRVPEQLADFAKLLSTWRFNIDWAATDYLSQTRKLRTPTLIFHGTTDTSVPFATSAEMARKYPDIVTLVTTRASHTRSWNVDPEAYETAIREFLAGLD